MQTPVLIEHLCVKERVSKKKNFRRHKGKVSLPREERKDHKKESTNHPKKDDTKLMFAEGR